MAIVNFPSIQGHTEDAVKEAKEGFMKQRWTSKATQAHAIACDSLRQHQ